MTTIGMANYPQYPVVVQEVVGILRMLDTSPPYSVLDVGCGEGVLGYLLKHHSNNRQERIVLDGIEPDKSLRPSLEAEKVYRYILPTTVEDYCNDDKNYDKSGYDIVIGNHVFEHLTLEELYRCIEFFKRRDRAIFLNFPTPKKHHQLKLGDKGLHSHKLRFGSKNGEELGLSRVTARGLPNAYNYIREKKERRKVNGNS